MNDKERNIATRINGLLGDIKNYIDSNPDWIYYFLNPLAGGNDELFECMGEHPDDWEDYIDFEVSNISGSSIRIEIRIDNYTDCGIVLPRYINILNFEETVKKNKMLYDGKLDEIRRNNIKEDIIRLKDILNKKEEELKKLEKGE